MIRHTRCYRDWSSDVCSSDPRLNSSHGSISYAVFCINRKTRDMILATKPGRIIMHDWWCYLIVSALGKVFHGKTVNIKYRQHAGNVIGGTSSFLLSVYRRSREFLKSGKDAFRVRDQAVEFLRCYGHLLDDKNSRILRRFIESKNTFSSRFQYSLAMDVWV